MLIFIVLGIIALIIICYISIYNKLRRLSVKVEEGSSGIDVALEKRYDMLSEEIEAVKKFLKHEYDTYVSVTSIRKGKDLEEETFKEKSALSREALKNIDEAIEIQQQQMQQIKKQIQKTRQYQSKRKEYQNSVEQYKMSINNKIGMLSSIQQSLGGVGSAIDALSEQYPVLYSHVSMEYFQRMIYDAEEHLQAARRLYNSNVSLYNQKIVMFPYIIVAKIHGMNKADFYKTDEKKKEYTVNFD